MLQKTHYQAVKEYFGVDFQNFLLNLDCGSEPSFMDFNEALLKKNYATSLTAYHSNILFHLNNMLRCGEKFIMFLLKCLLN